MKKKLIALLVSLSLCISMMVGVHAMAEGEAFSVSLGNIENNAAVSGTVAITVETTGGELVSYDAYLDGSLLLDDETEEVFYVDTTKLTNGDHVFGISATDGTSWASSQVVLKVANLNISAENMLYNVEGGSDIATTFIGGEVSVENDGETAKFTEVGPAQWGGATSASFMVNFTKNPVLELNVASISEGAKYDIQMTFVKGAANGMDWNKYVKDQVTATGLTTYNLTECLRAMKGANSSADGIDDVRLESMLTTDAEYEVALFFFLRDLDGAVANVRSIRIYYPEIGDAEDKYYTRHDLLSFTSGRGGDIGVSVSAAENGYINFSVPTTGQYSWFMPTQSIVMDFSQDMYIEFDVANIYAQWGIRYQIDDGAVNYLCANKGEGTDGHYLINLKANETYRNGGHWVGFNQPSVGEHFSVGGKHTVKIGLDIQNAGAIANGAALGKYGYDIANLKVYHGAPSAVADGVAVENTEWDAEAVAGLEAASASVATEGGVATITKANEVTMGGVSTGEIFVDFARTPKIEISVENVTYAYDVYVYVDGGMKGYSLLNNSTETGEVEVWILSGITANEPLFDKISTEKNTVHSIRFAIYASGVEGEADSVSVSSFALVYDEVEPEPVVEVERVLVTGSKSTVEENEELVLTANVIPEGAAVNSVVWYVNDALVEGATELTYTFKQAEVGTYRVVAEVNGIKSAERKIVVNEGEPQTSETPAESTDTPAGSDEGGCVGGISATASAIGILALAVVALRRKH